MGDRVVVVVVVSVEADESGSGLQTSSIIAAILSLSHPGAASDVLRPCIDGVICHHRAPLNRRVGGSEYVDIRKIVFYRSRIVFGIGHTLAGQ